MGPLRRVALCPVTSTRMANISTARFPNGQSPLPLSSCSDLELQNRTACLSKDSTGLVLGRVGQGSWGRGVVGVWGTGREEKVSYNAI